MGSASMTIAYFDDAMAQEAEAILAESGLTLSDAFCRLVIRTVKQEHVSLDLLSPSAETLEAMAELDRGEGESFRSIEELMTDLNADD